MGDLSGKIDVEQLISLTDDLVEVLKEQKDIQHLTHCLEQSKALYSSCDVDSDIQRSIEDYHRKIDTCRKKTEEARISEVAAEAEIDHLQKELEEELEKERALRDELRVMSRELDDLECQRFSIEERKKILKNIELDELKAQRKLSMLASVTNIIPSLDGDSKISGHIVDRDKKKIQKFEFDSTKMSAYDTCDSLWKMINMR